ncbi:MAG: hypothetical protein HC850_17560, partial [Rhodomicrobium sp.]|nr:hypothetical protein [Rhodomicrobium sp.]
MTDAIVAVVEADFAPYDLTVLTTNDPAPAGPFTIEVARGFEYDVAKATVDVKAGADQQVTIRMKRMVDFRARGWRSGSNHVHMNYAGNLHNTPANMLLMAK